MAQAWPLLPAPDQGGVGVWQACVCLSHLILHRLCQGAPRTQGQRAQRGVSAPCTRRAASFSAAAQAHLPHHHSSSSTGKCAPEGTARGPGAGQGRRRPTTLATRSSSVREICQFFVTQCAPETRKNWLSGVTQGEGHQAVLDGGDAEEYARSRRHAQ